jgi:hypothetical protein
MRFRAGLFVSIFLVLLGVGCRKPLAPNIDSNIPPETWITAAPQDTITIRDEFNQPIAPAVGTIPFRFHVYWAGSDQDGAVSGYYYAVVETVTTPGLPRSSLPGPKPRDYKFTTRSDSTFSFNVFEESRVREHAFFIYAVDNNGKPDPTPARFIFFARSLLVHRGDHPGDRDRLHVRSQQHERAGRAGYDRTFPIRSRLRSTRSLGSQLRFKWIGEEVRAEQPGDHLQVQAQGNRPSRCVHGGLGDLPSGNSDRRQAVPAARRGSTGWLALGCTGEPHVPRELAPTPGSRARSERRRAGRSPMASATAIVSWIPKPTIPGSILTADSMRVMPKDRVPRRTFLELYKNRIYLRAENDTIDVNSWVLFDGGGFDPDSPYNVRVSGFAFPPSDTSTSPVLQKRAANASPIALRLSVPVDLYPAGPVSSLPQSAPYPLDEALAPPEAHIGGYIGLQQAGRAFAVLQAVDGDGAQDRRLNPERVPAFVDSCERGIMPSFRLPLRSLIISFYVNRAPTLPTSNGAFRLISGATQPTRTIPLNLLSFDEDPYDPSCARSAARSRPRPRPSTLPLPSQGKLAPGWTPYLRPCPVLPQRASAHVITVPSSWWHQRPVEVELCDFPDNAYIPGQGRCRSYSFPVIVPPPTVPPGASATTGNSPRPGFSELRSVGKSQ